MKWLIKSVLKDLMPRTEDLPGIEDTDIDQFIGQFRREAPGHMYAGLLLGTFMYTVTPLFTTGIPLPSFWLPMSLRDTHAQRLSYSEIYYLRQLVFMVKLVGGLCWAADPKVREQFNLAPLDEDPGTWRQA